jgi:hypothetical protein
LQCHDAFKTFTVQEEGTNTPDQPKEGAAVMDGDVAGGKSAGWLRRSGLAKVQHHGCSLV